MMYTWLTCDFSVVHAHTLTHMPVVPTGLQKRYIYYSTGWKWPLILVILAPILFIIVIILLSNFRRRKRGQSPIKGTGWLAPPPYVVSQQQYRTSDGGAPPPPPPPATDGNAPVPEYTARADTARDAGYYDRQGAFHPVIPPKQPPPAVVYDSTSSSHSNYQRPSGPPPNVSDGIYGFARPQSPSPTAKR